MNGTCDHVKNPSERPVVAATAGARTSHWHVRPWFCLALLLALPPLFGGLPSFAATTNKCIECHARVTPRIVSDWRLSKHAKTGISCEVCHGSRHQTAADYKLAAIPTPDTCAPCHAKQVAEFKQSKHALAWSAMKAMPTFHEQPMAMTEGMKGCGGCHQIGLKTPAEIAQLRREGNDFGIASCDACHTRHTFSVKEARQPQACESCHMGFDHAQWEMYESSKHGVRNSLKQLGILPKTAAAPTCQTCHMPGGNHDVQTAWGFLAVRLPLPAKDKQWAADQVTILKALGVLDPNGKPTPRLAAVKKLHIARLTEASWQRQRDEMLKSCTQCHSRDFVNEQLQLGDKMIRRSDHLMAQAIRIVAGLYRDGILKQPKNSSYAYPDILTFYNAHTEIEQKLFVMMQRDRMRSIQGTFHASPDYALWYGWGRMERDLTDIKTLAAELRREHSTASGAKK
jgi:hydroxylamine dehydrogenase